MDEQLKSIFKKLGIHDPELFFSLLELSNTDLSDYIDAIYSCTEKLSKCGKCCDPQLFSDFIKVQYKATELLLLLQKTNEQVKNSA